mmetsp:Transcript_17418/g.65901  ORF Transcript_17418/g.65901 Transcript_17418/m.65901 type:complete len:338 (-) Transcript_17418:71-1084(-)
MPSASVAEARERPWFPSGTTPARPAAPPRSSNRYSKGTDPLLATTTRRVAVSPTSMAPMASDEGSPADSSMRAPASPPPSAAPAPAKPNSSRPGAASTMTASLMTNPSPLTLRRRGRGLRRTEQRSTAFTAPSARGANVTSRGMEPRAGTVPDEGDTRTAELARLASLPGAPSGPSAPPSTVKAKGTLSALVSCTVDVECAPTRRRRKSIAGLSSDTSGSRTDPVTRKVCERRCDGIVNRQKDSARAASVGANSNAISARRPGRRVPDCTPQRKAGWRAPTGSQAKSQGCAEGLYARNRAVLRTPTPRDSISRTRVAGSSGPGWPSGPGSDASRSWR